MNEEEEYEEVKEEDEEEDEGEEAEAEIIRACVKRTNIPLPSSSFPPRSFLSPLLALSDLSFIDFVKRFFKKDIAKIRLYHSKTNRKFNPYLLWNDKLL